MGPETFPASGAWTLRARRRCRSASASGMREVMSSKKPGTTTLIDRKVPDAQAKAVSEIHGNLPDLLLEILHDVQREAGFISDKAIFTIADQLNLSRAEVLGVVSFYDDFLRAPLGGLDVRVCQAEACLAVGAGELYRWARASLHDDEVINVRHVYCLGNCALGPSAMISGRLHGRLTAASLEAACRAEQMASRDE